MPGFCPRLLIVCSHSSISPGRDAQTASLAERLFHGKAHSKVARRRARSIAALRGVAVAISVEEGRVAHDSAAPGLSSVVTNETVSDIRAVVPGETDLNIEPTKRRLSRVAEDCSKMLQSMRPSARVIWILQQNAAAKSICSTDHLHNGFGPEPTVKAAAKRCS